MASAGALIERYQAFDKAVGPAVVSALVHSLGWEVDPPAKVLSGMPFVDSPVPLLCSLAAYGAIVALGLAAWGVIGVPKDKKPDGPALRALVMFHNVFLVALSAYMCFGTLLEVRSLGYVVWGNPFRESETKLAHYVYVFYISKLYEFMDTFIMLLKGNLNQVSFLHVYHHGTISFVWWMIARRAPGGDSYFSLALNSWVHVCMYTYYLLATLIKVPRSRSKYLWWGKYLTMMQMFQFALNFGQAIYCERYSEYPRFMSQILLWYMLSLLALFGHFFYQKHMSPKAIAAKKAAKAAKSQ